jgi:hypothetical protein
VSGPKLWSIVLLIAVIAGCSGIYALWRRTRRVEPAAPPPARVETAAPPPQPQPAAQTAPAVPPPETVKPAVPPPAPEPAPTDAKLDIEVAALETVWFSVTTDGKKTITVLKQGQSRRFAANERASLFIGNAGGLEIRVNGKPLGPAGPRGQLRMVVITPEGVSITNPREKKEPPPAAAKPGQ